MSRRAHSAIQLDRRFLKIPDAASGITGEASVEAAFFLDTPESWGDLLAHEYVVVLGEAGTGKTTEFILKAEGLAAQNQFAMFVEMVDLANDGLVASLDPEDEATLRAWRAGTDVGVFFLDSLDEAKLQRRTARQALRALRRELTTEWDRVRLVVSCRVSDWMPEADRAEVQAVIPAGANTQVHVVQLAPLKPRQVEQLAELLGVPNVPEFMRAVRENYAEAFVERPLDVGWMGAYWRRHGRIDSLRELVADNIQEKLKERPGRPSSLSVVKAVRGARALAGVAIAQNCWTFTVPDEAPDAGRTAGAVDPHDVLPDWSADEIRQLLSRPVFDESTFGRVRFHHRSVQEFLAAEWLDELAKAKLSRGALDEFLFRGESDEGIIPSHLGPVAVWLALRDTRLCRRLSEMAPALLIAHGDPAGFSAEVRQRILQAYASGYDDRLRRFDRFESAALKRFSAPVLADQIAELLTAEGTSDEFCTVLLQLVEHGRIDACAAQALSLASDQERAVEVRLYAIQATAAVGSESHKAALRGLLDTTDEWEQEVAAAFIRALYPEALDAAALVRVLSKTKSKRRNLTTSLQLVLEYEIPDAGGTALRVELLEALLEAAWSRDESGKRSVSTEWRWVLHTIAKLLTSVLDDVPEGCTPPGAVGIALELFQWCSEHNLDIWHGLEDVRENIEKRPDIRRELFWKRVAANCGGGGVAPTHYHELKFSYELFELGRGDRTWLAADACTRSDMRERLLAFDALASLPRVAGAEEEDLAFLQQVASSSPELMTRFRRMLNRPVFRGALSRRWELQKRAREIARAKRDQANRAALEARIEDIRAGADLHLLWFLYHQSEHRDGTRAGVSVEPIRRKFGEAIADAALAGWKTYWRTFHPPMPHERERRNTVPGGVTIGLVGLDIELAAGLDPAVLDAQSAMLAARYGGCELNSFPWWMEQLAEHQPVAVRDALGPALLADFAHPNTGEIVCDVLAKLPRAAAPVRAACAETLVAAIASSEPPMTEALRDTLAVVVGQGGIDDQAFDALARTRCEEAVEEPRRFGIWWCFWLGKNPELALEFVTGKLAELERDSAYQVVLEVCHQLELRSESRGPEPPVRLAPALLGRLIPIVYEYVKPGDDIEHEGVFCPGSRDHAQMIRGRLVSWLVGAPGAEAAEAVRVLARDERVGELRDWLLHRAGQQMNADAASGRSDVAAELTSLYRQWGTEAVQHLGALLEKSDMVKILFLGANPLESDRLLLDEEVRDIERKLRAARMRDAFQLHSKWAVRPADLQQALLDEEPTIVHFAGHGDGPAGLVFHADDVESESLVGADALRGLFRVLRDKVRLVVLNACLSLEQARAIVEEIEFVVGMSDEIDDDAARCFAAAFYRGLAFGRTVQTAFDLGINELQLNGWADSERIPMLLCSPGADPNEVVLASAEAWSEGR